MALVIIVAKTKNKQGKKGKKTPPGELTVNGKCARVAVLAAVVLAVLAADGVVVVVVQAETAMTRR